MCPRELERDEVLRFSDPPSNRATVRRHYMKWRREQGLPESCDNTTCSLSNVPCEWLGKHLPLILDHVNGNRDDNRPENLRLLCPNCDAQLPTRGGANAGRVERRGSRGYAVKERDGTKGVLTTEPSFEARGGFNVTGHKSGEVQDS